MKPEIKERFLSYLTNERGLIFTSANAYVKQVGYLYTESGSEILRLKKYPLVAKIIVDLKTSRNWSDRMTYKVASMVTVFFNWAFREGIIKESPFRMGHGFKKVETKQIDFFDWESDDFKKVIYNPNLSLKWLCMIHVLRSSGIRVSELVNLKLEDVQDRWLRIKQGKGGRDRFAPVDQETRNLLDTYITGIKFSGYSLPWLFPKEDMSGPTTSHNVQRVFCRMSHKLGVHVHAHKFRHSLGGRLIEKGADVTVVRDILGHKTLSSTSIYVHHKKDKLLEQFDKCL